MTLSKRAVTGSASETSRRAEATGRAPIDVTATLKEVPTMTKLDMLIALVYERPQDPESCWPAPWEARTAGGYAVIDDPGRTRGSTTAHRLVAAWEVGLYSTSDLPSHVAVDHVSKRGCVRRDCVNPAHLEIVTHRENNLRSESASSRNARKTHCPAGHALAGDNLSRAHLRQGGRACRVCVNVWAARRRARKGNAK